MTAACPACAVAPAAVDIARSDAQPDALYSVPSVHCAACIGAVERAASAVPGVRAARVNLSLKRLAIFGAAQDADICAAISNAGFDCLPLDEGELGPAAPSEERGLLMRLSVAGAAMMNVMLLSVAVWSGAADATRDLFHLISAAIAVPAVAYAAQPFFRNAMQGLSARRLNMDVPISLAIVLATGMSLSEALNSGSHAYFDAALSLTFFLLIGRYLDLHTRVAARSAARELTALEAHTAERLADGRVQTVRVADLAIGDIVMVTKGMRAPVDGVLQSAVASIDRSLVTGESAVQSVTQGATVQAGEINAGAPFQLRTTAVGEDTSLRQMAGLVALSEAGRNRYTALADQAARIYAPGVHLLALVAFLGWIAVNGDVRHALNVAVAVLIITCPCALGLAVPAVNTAAVGRLFSKGFLVKSATALERLAEVDTVVLDKTGTLTLAGTGDGMGALSPQEQGVAVALANASAHPVSREIARQLRHVAPATLRDVTEVDGCGVEGWMGDTMVRLGRADWLGSDFSGTGLAIGDAPPVPLGLVERLRPGAREVVDEFQKSSLAVEILTGDDGPAAARIAETLGIADVMPSVPARDKLRYLGDLSADGRRVLMIGDGLNDTGALAAAHASIAPSSALDAARNAADIVVLGQDFSQLPVLRRVAIGARRLSIQNFAIAALYNMIAIPIAVSGFATPLMAALAMSTSSITVLLNAQRIRRIT